MFVGYFGLILFYIFKKKKGVMFELNLEMEVFFFFLMVK